MSETKTLEYENDAGNARVIRKWEKLSETVVRETDTEMMYNYTTEQWEIVEEFTRDYDIDDIGRLVGDGSNWDGEGRMWKQWAEERHEERLRLRFPSDFGEQTHVPNGGDKELVKEVAARNMSL